MTNKLKKVLHRLWRDESGQGATEYILILVVVSTIVFVFKGEIAERIKELTKGSMTKVEGQIGNL